MAIDFPDSPSVDQQYSVGDRTWTWNGTYWQLSQTSSTFTASDDSPLNPSAGDIWFESDTGKTFIYYDQAWVEIGSATDLSDILSDNDGDTLVQVEASADEDKIRFSTAGTERVIVDNNGFVGVGMTPTLPLDVEGRGRFVSPDVGSTGAVILRQPSGNGSGSYIQWVNNENTAQKGYVYAGDDGMMEINPAGGTVSVTGTTDTDYLTIGGENVTPYTGRRNLLYNGAMQVNQRGTSMTGLTSTTYPPADRWVHSAGSGATYTNSVESDAPAGFASSMKFLCTSAGSPSYLICQQRLEGQDLQGIGKGTASAKELTVSFWVKSNVTGTFIAELYDHDNARQVGKTYTISASDTWEKKTIIFPADTTGAFDNDNVRSMDFSLWLDAGSTYTTGTLKTSWGTANGSDRAVGQSNLSTSVNNYWQVTGVQLELGDKATPFEHRSFGEEFALCKRYFETSYAYGTAFGTNQSSFPTIVDEVPFYAALGQTDGWGGMRTTYTVTKRAAPTVTVYRPDGTQGSIQIVYGSTPSSTYTSPTVKGNMHGHMVNTGNFATGSLIKVLYHYTASAEL